jgi:hypothetical protein
VHSFLHSYFLLSSSRNPGELLPSSCKNKGNPFHVPFFPRVTFQEFLFAGTMFLQKLVLFLPLPPKRNDSPACRPKTSKRCHTQQHNPQQRISVAALVGRSSLICCPLRLAKSFSWHVHLLSFHHTPLVWLVVVLPGGLPPPLSWQLHLLLHPPFVGCHVALRCDACASRCPSNNL